MFFLKITSLRGRSGHEMGFSHICKTTGLIFLAEFTVLFVYEKVTHDMISNLFDCNHSNLIAVTMVMTTVMSHTHSVQFIHI